MESLQRKAELRFGSMANGAGQIPSRELLYGFYHFYWNEDPMKGDTPDNLYLMNICSQLRQNVVNLARRHYGMSFDEFNNNFHVWNREQHPQEYGNRR
jgi:hypothetical protein